MQTMVLYRISRHTPHYSQYNQMASSYTVFWIGYISPLADEIFVFYLERGGTDPLVRDIRASCHLRSNLYQVARSAKFTASVHQLRHASHRAKCKRYILEDAQMCTVKCGWGDAFRSVLMPIPFECDIHDICPIWYHYGWKTESK